MPASREPSAPRGGPKRPALPDELAELLSVHGPALLEVGEPPGVTSERVQVVPLHDQLFVLVRGRGPMAAAVDRWGRAVLTAEHAGGDYQLRVRARAAVGRSAAAEGRRNELYHWLPDGEKAQDLRVLWLYPEHVEYVRGKGDHRVRTAGEVPGGALPPGFARWVRVAREGVLPFYFALLPIDWIFVLVAGIAPGTRVLLAALLLVAQVAMLGGVAVLHQRAVHLRYRESFATPAQDHLFLEGWLVPDEARLGAGVAIGFGLLLALFLGAGAGPWFPVVAVLGSGAPLLGLFFWVQHLARHADKEDERASGVGGAR